MPKAVIFFVTMVVCSVLAPGSVFAAGPFGTIHVANWQGGAYTDVNTGAFTHCAAGASYQTGNLITLALRTGGEWIIGFANPSWKMKEGESIPLEITFDGQSQFHLTGSVNSPSQVISIYRLRLCIDFANPPFWQSLGVRKQFNSRCTRRIN